MRKYSVERAPYINPKGFQDILQRRACEAVMATDKPLKEIVARSGLSIQTILRIVKYPKGRGMGLDTLYRLAYGLEMPVSSFIPPTLITAKKPAKTTKGRK